MSSTTIIINHNCGVINSLANAKCLWYKRPSWVYFVHWNYVTMNVLRQLRLGHPCLYLTMGITFFMTLIRQWTIRSSMLVPSIACSSPMLVLYHLQLLHQCVYYINCNYLIHACIISIEITSSMLVLYQLHILHQCLYYINCNYFGHTCII